MHLRAAHRASATIRPVTSAPAVQRAEPPPSLATPHYPLLDSLRGIAALSVFVAHFLIFIAPEVDASAFSPLLTRLDPGVAIFLLLSAFLLYRPFADARLERARGPATLPFFARRVFRIVPVYWVALTAVAIYFGMDYVFTPSGAPLYYGFLQIYDKSTITNGIGQAWTIAVEASFYVMLPVWALTMRLVRFNSRRAFLITELTGLALLWLCSLLWRWYWFVVTPPAPGLGPVKVSAPLFTLPAYLDALAVGMALAVVSVALAGRERQPAVVRLIDRRPWLPWVAAAVLFWLSGIGGGTVRVDSPAFYLLHQQFNVLVAVCLFLPAVFGTSDRGRLGRFLRTPALVWIATISYGFYLFHLPVMTGFARDGFIAEHGELAFFVVTFAVTAALGAVSYYGVGRYFVRLGHRLPRGRPRRAADAGSSTPASPPQPALGPPPST